MSCELQSMRNLYFRSRPLSTANMDSNMRVSKSKMRKSKSSMSLRLNWKELIRKLSFKIFSFNSHKEKEDLPNILKLNRSLLNGSKININRKEFPSSTKNNLIKSMFHWPCSQQKKLFLSILT